MAPTYPPWAAMVLSWGKKLRPKPRDFLSPSRPIHWVSCEKILGSLCQKVFPISSLPTPKPRPKIVLVIFAQVRGHFGPVFFFFTPFWIRLVQSPILTRKEKKRFFCVYSGGGERTQSHFFLWASFCTSLCVHRISPVKTHFCLLEKNKIWGGRQEGKKNFIKNRSYDI